MKITSVLIENFMAIGKATVSLADRGLVLVQGENDDESSAESNGAGKSSFADAISWCLYGTTARGEDTDNVVNRTAKKDCAVAVDIEDSGETFRIVRYRKHKIHKNVLRAVKLDPAGGGSTDLTKGTDKLTQQVVNQIIGCSYDVFCGAVYAGQERMPDLPGMTDKQLKTLIEEASGATLLEAAYKEANDRLNAVKRLVTANGAALTAADVRRVDAEIRRTDAIANKDKFETDRATRIRGLVEDIKKIKIDLEGEEAKLGTYRSAIDIHTDIKLSEAKIAATDAERKTETELRGKVSAAEMVLGRLDVTLAASKKTMEAAKNAIEKLGHTIGCACSSCGRPHTKETIGPATELAQETLDERTKEVVELVERRKKLVEIVEVSKNTLADHLAKMTDITAETATLTRLRIEEKALAIQAAVVDSVKRNLHSQLTSAKSIKDQENPFLAEIEKASVLVAEHEAALEAIREEGRKLATDQTVAELTAKVFSPAGVRAFLLDEVTPFLNAQTAKYLGTLSDGNLSATWSTLVKTGKGELREKFSIEVACATGGETFKSISGGEKRKVRVACALALQDLVARRATKPIELFIGDEIDDALDPAGLERLTMILEEKARERGSVFVISHSNLKDWIRTVLTVKKTGGKAVIEEAVA